MAGTRTAPDVTTAATGKNLSVHWIDNSSDIWSESYSIPVAATNAQIEAFLDGLQAGSNASIYKADISSVWGSDGLADSNNAIGIDPKSASVFDKFGFTMKHTTNPELKDKRVSVPAPIGDLFINDGTIYQDSPDPSAAEIVALATAALALFPSYAIVWFRYVEKKEINEKVRT